MEKVNKTVGFFSILAEALVALVVFYLINVIFFYPSLDDFFKLSMVLASIAGLLVRFRVGCWSVGPLKPIIFPFLVYTLVLVLSYYWKGGFSSTVEMLSFSLLFLYCVSLVKPNLRYLVFSCLVASVQMLFFIISQDLGQWERLGGAVNPIFFGIFSFLLSVVSFYLSFHERIKVIKASLWIASLIFMVASVLTQSRGVIIAYVPIIFLVCMYLFFSRSWRLKEFFVPLVILVAIGAWSLYQGNLLNRFSQMFNEMDKVTTQTEKNDSVFRTSIGHRIMVWSYSWDVALENPVFGVGNKRYQELKVEWAENSRYPKALAESLPGSHAHSQYFQEIALRGFIGLFSLAFLFLYPLYFGVKFIRLNDRSTHYAGYMLVSIVIGFVVFSLSEVALKHPDKIAMFVIFNFLAVRLCQESAAVEKRPAI